MGHDWKYDRSAMMPVPNNDAVSGAMYDVWTCMSCGDTVTVMDTSSDWGFLNKTPGGVVWTPYVGPRNAPPPPDHIVNGMQCGDKLAKEVMDL